MTKKEHDAIDNGESNVYPPGAPKGVGLSKREYIAAALHGPIYAAMMEQSVQSVAVAAKELGCSIQNAVATMAVQEADRLLAALEKNEPGSLG